MFNKKIEINSKLNQKIVDNKKMNKEYNKNEIKGKNEKINIEKDKFEIQDNNFFIAIIGPMSGKTLFFHRLIENTFLDKFLMGASSYHPGIKNLNIKNKTIHFVILILLIYYLNIIIGIMLVLYVILN